MFVELGISDFVFQKDPIFLSLRRGKRLTRAFCERSPARAGGERGLFSDPLPAAPSATSSPVSGAARGLPSEVERGSHTG